MMTENFIRHSKKALTVVSIILVFFFFFTFNSYADEFRGKDLLTEIQDVLGKVKSLNESGDRLGAKEVMLKFLKASLENIPDDMSMNDYMSMYTGEDINKITDINKELLGIVGYLDETVMIYKDAYKTRPDSEIILKQYITVLLKYKQYDEAAPLMEKDYIVSGENNPWALLWAAQAYYLAQKPSEAKRIVDKMMELPGAPHPGWLPSFYQICLASGDVDEANTYLEAYNKSATIKKISDKYVSGFQGDYQQCPSDDETGSAPDKIYEMDDLDDRPKPVQVYMPVYPIKAIVEGIEGRVVVKFVVTKDGYAAEPVVFKADPEGIFEEAALDAVTEYRFIPAKKDGKCVACVVMLPVNFKPGPKPGTPGVK